jgi:hypothetical protein
LEMEMVLVRVKVAVMPRVEVVVSSAKTATLLSFTRLENISQKSLQVHLLLRMTFSFGAGLYWFFLSLSLLLTY